MSNGLGPFTVRWNGEEFEPTGRTRAVAPRLFKPGKEYVLIEYAPRNINSHKSFFAECRDVWMALPPHQAERFPDIESLRKHALCRAGFCETVRQIALPSRAEAVRLFRELSGDYDLATITGNVIVLMKAASMKFHRMDGQTFMQAKRAVQEVLAEVLGETKESPAQGRAKSSSLRSSK